MDKYVTLEEFRELFSQHISEPDLDPYVNDELVRDLKTWEVREDDVWVVTYPKAGTTWAKEIVSCVMHDGDLKAVNKRHSTFRVPFLEQTFSESIRRLKNLPKTHRILEEMPSPRVIKSHLPPQLLPPQLWEKKPKIVYVIRNPKDLVVSLFYFSKMHEQEKAKPFEDFVEEMSQGIIDVGPWWDHYLYFWKKRHEPNILLLRFEDMKRDLRGNVERISRFLGKNLPAEKLDAIKEHCTFNNMKSNPMTNPEYFYPTSEVKMMRKGKIGDWKSHFTVAQNETMDALIKEKLHGTGLTFDY